MSQNKLYIALLHLLDTETKSENILTKLNLKIEKKEKTIKYKEYILNSKEQELQYLKNKELKLLKAREILLRDENQRLQDLKRSYEIRKKKDKKINEDEGAKKFKEVELIFSKQFNTLKDKQKSINKDIEKIRKTLIRINYKLDVLKKNIQEEKVKYFFYFL